MSWVASEVVALEIASSVRSGFGLSRIARLLPGLETKHALYLGQVHSDLVARTCRGQTRPFRSWGAKSVRTIQSSHS